MSRRPKTKLVLAFAFCAVGLSGCGEGSPKRYIPPEELAQHTLETALQAWQRGKEPPLILKEGSPAINLVDTHHQSGQKLTGFTVLGPTTADADRCYAVRLMLDNPREEVRARFVVLGIDPLWVLRYEDYEMVMHWDMPPEKPAGAKKPAS